MFLERCKRAGLPQGNIDRLQDQQLTSLAKLAFAAGQPGETPTDTKLKSLVQIRMAEVPVHVVAALRQVVFEAQTLLISQVKALVERRDDEDKPQKTLTISAGSVTVKDQKLDLECETQAPLDLHWALTRRSLACDLVGLATYDKQQEWHSHLMRHLSSDDPPPGYSKNYGEANSSSRPSRLATHE